MVFGGDALLGTCGGDGGLPVWAPRTQPSQPTQPGLNFLAFSTFWQLPNCYFLAFFNFVATFKKLFFNIWATFQMLLFNIFELLGNFQKATF